MIARSWASDLIDFLLPTGCLSCRAWRPADAGRDAGLLCPPCRARLGDAAWPRCPRCHHPSGTGRRRMGESALCIECREWPDALTAARYAVRLDGPAADLVHALKYEGWAEAAGEMGDRMASTIARHGPWVTEDEPACSKLLVPVPTTPERERRRGYNQARLLARHVAGTTGLPLVEALTRRDSRASQTSLTPRERVENVHGAFVVTAVGATALPAAHVVLVDDVLTTGATAGEAAQVLTRAGAASVTLLAYARSTPVRPGMSR